MADVTSGIKAYGDALFSLAEELGETESVRLDAEALSRIIASSPEYHARKDSVL